MDRATFQEAITLLKKAYPTWDAPAKQFATLGKRTPYEILVSALLSFRTKDATTYAAQNRLLARANTPEAMVRLPLSHIEEAIYPVGFWRKKAQTLHHISQALMERYDGKVPASQKALTSLPGVGPKVAAILLEHAFDQPIVAVDTHVHRILNLWHFVQTTTPQQTQALLEQCLKEEEKRGLNRLLVAFGQTLCRPHHPLCARCPIVHLCPAADTPLGTTTSKFQNG